MRANYGVDVWLPAEVVVFDMSPRRPVFHQLDRSTLGWTMCGRPTWDPDTNTATCDVLPTRHARRFARPCRYCWPALRQATLELEVGPL
jgi:hypothetical protein